MNKHVATLGAAAAGALAMYYLDPELGARRRALLADLVRGGLPGERRGAAHARRARLRAGHADPRSDAELRDRIRDALDRMVSHPRALNVEVDQGVVRLSGRVLVKEREGVLHQVQRMPGVQRLVNATSAHDDPQELASTGRTVPLTLASR